MFDIIEPHEFRKYSKCWVLEKSEEPCRIYRLGYSVRAEQELLTEMKHYRRRKTSMRSKMLLEEMTKEEVAVQDFVFFCCCRSLGDSTEFQLLIPDYIDINSNS